MNRKPKLIRAMKVEVSGYPESWAKRSCKIDGDKIFMLHSLTYGLLNGEPTWFCKRCGAKMEHPLRV